VKKICFQSSNYVKNECFSSDYGRDNFIYFISNLKPYFLKYGFDIATHDINSPESSDIILRLGFEKGLQLGPKNKSYLIALESPHFDPAAIATKNHGHFQKIFTNNDDLIDNKKYFKVNYAYDIPKLIPKQFKTKKLCCVLAGNKSAHHPNELYTKRVAIIRWFEDHHPRDLDLYGIGWDQYRFGHSFIGRILNKPKIFRKKKLFPSYRGIASNKFILMQNYKFSICYENIQGQNGYITEKIFDCFFAGCVPVYWGAKNIGSHIPHDCFIDKRNFKSFEDLYLFMNSMSSNEYLSYLKRIEIFLNSEAVKPFSAAFFAETIIREINFDTRDVRKK